MSSPFVVAFYKSLMSRIFINNIDSYFGSVLSALFVKTVVGSLRDDAFIQPDDVTFSSENEYYRVSGTHNSSSPPLPILDVLYHPVDYGDLLSKVIQQDIIIYDITEDPKQIVEAEFVVNNLHQNLESFMQSKTFILISTCLTWGKTRPIDPDEPNGVFTEDDYRMRRPHPSFKEHITLEKLVTKLGRTKKNIFSTYVISCGIVYGHGECLLHFLFKQAWLGGSKNQSLPVFGSGQNRVPTIHVDDLSSIVLNIVEFNPKPRFFLAVDDSHSTLEEIVKAISIELGTGNIRNLTREEALFVKDVDNLAYDTLLVNIRMEARYLKENLKIRWSSEFGLVDGISHIVNEFKFIRRLLPLQLCILGPPGCGKSTIARKLAEYYKVHHVTIAEVITEQIEVLKNLISRESDNGLDEEREARAEQAKDLLDSLKENSSNNAGRYEDNFIIDFFKTKLNSKPCQNQGFVLDGFPKTFKQALDLFGTVNNLQPNESLEETPVTYNRKITPSFVIQVDASDDFLKERLILLPQDLIEGTHNSEDNFIRRLTDYQSANSIEPTVLNFFDENEIDIYKLDLNTGLNIQQTVRNITDKLGPAKNYGPTDEEREEILRNETEMNERALNHFREQSILREIEEVAKKTSLEAIWSAQMREIKFQQFEFLECQAMPLRNYLIKYVMSTLIKGLVSISKSRPDDPIDYLAEYLFKCNPCID